MSDSFHKQNPLNNYYRGTVRQRGSGIGSLALKVACHALPLLSKYVLPSAKRVGKDFALNLLPDLFDVVTGRGGEPATSPSIKKAVKHAAGKTVKKHLGTNAAKKKRGRQSVGRSSKTKNSRTAKKGRKKHQEAKQQQQKRFKNAKRLTFPKLALTVNSIRNIILKTMTTTAAHIIPKPATHSSLDIFSKPEVLVSFDTSFEQETLPVTAHDAPVFEFVLTTDGNIYLDLQSVELKLEAKNGKGANGNTNLETELAGGNTVAKATDKVSFINNTLHSFFSNCDILINNEIVHTSINLYAQRAFVETELSHTQGCATTKLITQGYNFEPATGDMLAHRETWTLGSASKTFYGKLAVDLLACDQLLIPNCSMRIRLTRNKPEYLL